MNFESKSLLTDTISTPIQKNVTDVKFPCTGFCYMAIRVLDQIVGYYLMHNVVDYKDLITQLILMAGERKRDDKTIDEDGEFLNGPTVERDFGELVHGMTFQELSITTDDDYEITINTLYAILFDIQINTYVLINRSHESFLMIKIGTSEFLIIDSHQDIHGVVSLENATKYITRDQYYKGFIQIGYMIMHNL